ncbi:MAG: hypothetical protein ACXAEL_06450 [Candidatus Hodarchaeales archaeon]
MGATIAPETVLGPKALYFVIFRRTGIGIFSRTLSGNGEKEIQETLFSGLLSGIMTFADEMIGGAISVLKIEDKDVILEGETDSDIVFCLVATRDDPAVRRLMPDIRTRFQLRFGALSQLGFEFEEQALASFGLELDRMVENWEKDVAQSVLIRGLSFCFFEHQQWHELSCELSLAFALASKKRRTIKGGLLKRKKESIARFVRLLLPCYLVPIEGLGFAIASPFFLGASDLRMMSPEPLVDFYTKAKEEKDAIALLKEAVFQVVLPKDSLGAKTANFAFRAEFKAALKGLRLIPGWNSLKLPIKNKKSFVEEVSSNLASAFQFQSKIRSLLEESRNLILTRFQRYEEQVKKEIFQLEEKFRKEREEVSKEVDEKVVVILKKQKEKRAGYTRYEKDKFADLDWETDKMIEAEERRLAKHDQKRENRIGTSQTQIKDARRLLRNLDARSEQTIKATLELDDEIKSSLIPPKQLIDIFQENIPGAINESALEGAIRIFIPFYVIAYSATGDTREEVISPGRGSKDSSNFGFEPWEAMHQAACSAWDQISTNIEFVRKLDSFNIIRAPDARSLIVDGLRKLKDDWKMIDEKSYERLIVNCKQLFKPNT